VFGGPEHAPGWYPGEHYHEDCLVENAEYVSAL
jgi:hypothetical protein